ncbi:hypothetical protein BTVI_00783 [Pitangus sulphuratus]|nr:hypothetical protein BTVI_00783 [Pitangus sulphuratus]
MMKTMVRQAVPLQPMEIHSGADIHLQPVEDPTLEQVDALESSCDPIKSPHWSKLLAGPVTHERGAHVGAGLLTPWRTHGSVHLLIVMMLFISPTLGYMSIDVADLHAHLLYPGSDVSPHLSRPDEFPFALPVDLSPSL